mmetsp:Transcript_116571/g.202801  ORF Transcript_116571/g.202801 Transcript_116571/m.202801 type:complete len:85 (+) Transcript_116571:183-437(+)
MRPMAAACSRTPFLGLGVEQVWLSPYAATGRPNLEGVQVLNSMSGAVGQQRPEEQPNFATSRRHCASLPGYGGGAFVVCTSPIC